MAFMGAALNEFGLENLHTVYKKNEEVSRINWKSKKLFLPLAFLFSKCRLPPFQPGDPFATASLCETKRGDPGGISRPYLASTPAFLPGQQENGSEPPTDLEMIQMNLRCFTIMWKSSRNKWKMGSIFRVKGLKELHQ
jgi:hypothetical protein